MTKSRKNWKMSNFEKKAVPIVSNSLHSVGNVAKKVVVNTAPVVEKGISTVYGTLATGFDLGVKGANKFIKMSKKLRHRKTHKRRKTHRRR
jgi:hypothetical protein